MKFLKFLTLVVALELCLAKPPELKPIAEGAKACLEKAVYQGLVEAGPLISTTLYALSAAAPVLAVVDVGLRMIVPSEFEQLQQNHREVIHRFDSLERFLTRSFDSLKKEVKFNELAVLQSKLKSEFEAFERLISTHGNDLNVLGRKVDEFIGHYHEKNFESRLVSFLLEETISSESPLAFLYKTLVDDLKNAFNSKKTSPNQIMFDYYHSLAFLVYKRNAMLSYCYSLKDKLLRQDSTSEQNEISARTKRNVQKLHDAFLALSSLSVGLNTYPDLRVYENLFNLDAGYSILYHYAKRYMHLGKIEAAERGFVITGVRFQVEEESGRGDKTVYLQAQVGKLLPNGSVDANSIYWQSAPSDLKTSRIELSGTFLLFDDLNFENAALTGYEFYKRDNDFVALRIHGKTFNNDGTLGYAQSTQNDAEKSNLQKKLFWRWNWGSRQPHSPGLNDDYLHDESRYQMTSSPTRGLFLSFYNGFKFSYVPSIDGNPVTLSNPMALSGLGLMHYTNDDTYGGYIKPYLKTMHFKNFI